MKRFYRVDEQTKSQRSRSNTAFLVDAFSLITPVTKHLQIASHRIATIEEGLDVVNFHLGFARLLVFEVSHPTPHTSPLSVKHDGEPELTGHFCPFGFNVDFQFPESPRFVVAIFPSGYLRGNFPEG